MGKKRKSRPTADSQTVDPRDELHDDSEDEFYAGRDKILLEETPAAKRRRKIEEHDIHLQPSDEEVFQDDIGEDDEQESAPEPSEDDGAVGVDSDEEEDERVWGTSKQDYYNNDTIETEQDALEEEAEARRLQEKHLKKISEADFGFDESDWVDPQPVSATGRSVVEKLPPVQIPETATNEERMRILTSRYPEFVPLAEDLLDLQDTRDALLQQVRETQTSENPGMQTTSSIFVTKLHAVTAYMAAIAMYIAILTSTKDGLALPPAELREHAIMNSILRCRQVWEDVKDLEDADEVFEMHVEESNQQTTSNSPEQIKADEQGSSEPHVRAKGQQVHPLAKKQLQPTSKDKVQSRTSPSKKEKKPKPIGKSDIKDLISQATMTKHAEQDSDFGDEEPLTQEEAAEKARKKRSLRFYTSQISQKASKRGTAARNAGGDDDLPYKERIRDKQERLMREAEHRASKMAPVADNDESGDEHLVREVNDQSNDYYNEIVTKSKQKKAEKQARAEAYAQATREGAQVHEQEHIGPDGKRKISYAIEKNKGLIPKRKKDVRNPRVKKKKRYEQKMKKLSSIRPVYKGGEGKGGYKGELTGIKTNLIKGVKL